MSIPGRGIQTGGNTVRRPKFTREGKLRRRGAEERGSRVLLISPQPLSTGNNRGQPSMS